MQTELLQTELLPGGSAPMAGYTIFHVWGGELTSDGPTKDEADYAAEYVYFVPADLWSNIAP